MKSIPQKRNRKKRFLLLTIIVLIAIAGTIAGLYIHRLYKQSNSQNQGSTQQTNNDPAPTVYTNAGQKQQAADNEAQNKDNGGNTNPDNSSQPSPSADSVSFTTKVENDSLIIVTKLQSFTGSGTCQLTLSNGGSSIRESAQVVYQSEYSTCAGFSIPLSKLSDGTWSILLSVTNASGTASKTGVYTK